MTPVTINLPDIVAGDTWEGVSIGPVLINGAQPASALASCRLYFRGGKTKALAYGYKSTVATGFGLINITNATTWQASIPAQALPIVTGQYVWDFETTDAAGVIRTLYKGVLTVKEDVSHD